MDYSISDPSCFNNYWIMKKIHIALLVMVLVAIGLFVKSSSELGTYGSFSDSGENKMVKVVGILAADPQIHYDPEDDPNLFSFHMEDMEGTVRKVVLNTAKPTDFERSEQIVVSGKINGDIFEANDILLKCPSKYKDEELFIRSDELRG